jgi:hypothetical protein
MMSLCISAKSLRNPVFLCLPKLGWFPHNTLCGMPDNNGNCGFIGMLDNLIAGMPAISKLGGCKGVLPRDSYLLVVAESSRKEFVK